MGTAGCPSSIGGYTKLGEFENHAYFLSTTEDQWEDAKITIENDGGYFATMNSPVENDFVKDNIGNAQVFIGFNDANLEGNVARRRRAEQ